MLKFQIVALCFLFLPQLYPNNLKNGEFGEEAPQNSHLERANIVGVQGASEDENFEEKPTLPKTNSSSCLGISVFTQYYSQVGQDVFVNEIFFKNFKHGVFVDVGAHDGVSFSNTYFFEKELDWTGLCLEPNPSVYTQLRMNRNCLCVCGCAANEHNVTKRFLKITGQLEMLSGLIDKYDIQLVPHIERLFKELGGEREVIDVPCYDLNQLLEKAGIDHVHLLSLDTEGGEYEILSNFDFSKCQVDVITVEDNLQIYPFISLLESHGMFKYVQSLAQDLIFVNKNSPWIKNIE